MSYTGNTYTAYAYTADSDPDPIVKIPTNILRVQDDPYLVCFTYKTVYVWGGIWGNEHRDNDMPAAIHVYYEYNYTKYDYDLSRQRYIMYEWFQHSKLHRDNDRPAVVCSDMKKWYQRGVLYREEDKPATVGVTHMLPKDWGEQYKSWLDVLRAQVLWEQKRESWRSAIRRALPVPDLYMLCARYI